MDLRPARDCAYDLVSLGEVMLRLDPGEGRIRTSRSFRAKRTAATKARTASSAATATRAAEAADKKLDTAESKLADLKKKLAANAASQTAKQRALATAEDTARRAADRDDERRRRKERTHALDLHRLATQPLRHSEVQPPAPEPLRVLYLTATPNAEEVTTTAPDGTITQTGTWLRVDKEFREVQKALRRAKYRDLVHLEHRPAATAQDLLDAINDIRPHVVHFSGHSWDGGVVLDDDTLDTTDGHDVDFALLARALSATTTPPRLVVLNACETLGGADELLQVAPVVIAMSDTIDDTAAIVFARQFYAAIAAAQSVSAALEQARLGMMFATTGDEDLPRRGPAATSTSTPSSSSHPQARPTSNHPRRSRCSTASRTPACRSCAWSNSSRAVDILTGEELERATGLLSGRVKVELRRLHGDGFVGGKLHENQVGAIQVLEPRLTAKAIAALAHSSA